MGFFQHIFGRRRQKSRNSLGQYDVLYRKVVTDVLADAEAGYVRFALGGETPQVHADLEWFAMLTGDSKGRTLLLFALLRDALCVMLGYAGRPAVKRETPLPIFLTSEGHPVVEYLFWGDCHVRCSAYDASVAEAMEEVKSEK